MCGCPSYLHGQTDTHTTCEHKVACSSFFVSWISSKEKMSRRIRKVEATKKRKPFFSHGATKNGIRFLRIKNRRHRSLESHTKSNSLRRINQWMWNGSNVCWLPNPKWLACFAENAQEASVFRTDSRKRRDRSYTKDFELYKWVQDISDDEIFDSVLMKG